MSSSALQKAPVPCRKLPRSQVSQRFLAMSVVCCCPDGLRPRGPVAVRRKTVPCLQCASSEECCRRMAVCGRCFGCGRASDAGHGNTLLSVQLWEVAESHWVHHRHNIQHLFQACDATQQTRPANEPSVDVGSNYPRWSRNHVADSNCSSKSLMKANSQMMSLDAIQSNSCASLTRWHDTGDLFQFPDR